MAGQDDIALALWYMGPGRAEIRQERLGPPLAGALRIRAMYGSVSRGTEGLIFHGRVPATEFQRMRAPHMGGTFPFPVKYGYSNVGRVESGPREYLGRAVFALYPHQTLYDLAPQSVVVLPDDMPSSRAVLAANMETALNAVWDAGLDLSAPPSFGRRIAVVGAGVVGTLVGYLCSKIPGTQVTLVDIDPGRADIARALGLRFAEPAAAPIDCHIVFHASASAAGLACAINIAADEGSILELSWYGSGTVAVPLGGAFHSRRLRLISSQVGKVALSHRAEWTPRRRLEAAVGLLRDSRLDMMLSPAVAFRELPATLPDILAPQSGILCQLINY